MQSRKPAILNCMGLVGLIYCPRAINLVRALRPAGGSDEIPHDKR
jgi:hypothetical protein